MGIKPKPFKKIIARRLLNKILLFNFQMKAIISVSDKTGVIEFAKSIVVLGYEILASEGTAKVLSENKIKVTKISDYTGFSEILDGRIKTMHPKVMAGILADTTVQKHNDELLKNKIDSINLVVCNLYPFKETISKPGCTFEEAIDNIDIGGVTLLRAAAKNYKSVASD